MKLMSTLLSIFVLAVFGASTSGYPAAVARTATPVGGYSITVADRVHLPEADRDFARPALRGLMGVAAAVPAAVAVPSVIPAGLPPQLTKRPTVVAVVVAVRKPVKPVVSTVTKPVTASVASWEARIGWCESRNNYKDYNSASGASGRYQFLKTTWNSNVKKFFASKYLGRAMDYSPAVQDAVFVVVFEHEGARPWDASRSCWENR